MAAGKITSPAELESRQAETLADMRRRRQEQPAILIGSGTCGRAAGALDVQVALRDAARDRRIRLQISTVGCIGMCSYEPLVDVALPGQPRVTYASVTPEMAERIIVEHVIGGKPVTEWVLSEMAYEPLFDGERMDPLYTDLPQFRKQLRIVMRNCGIIDPERIDAYIARGGYQALAKALTIMTPEQVIEEVTASGLRGRGGGGFPAGRKWAITRASPGKPKYVVCNADEGDPGAFMDRSILEGDPHAVIEGMIICGYAVGAHEGYIYCRAEYPLAIERLKTAIAQAERYGLLGENILGTGFGFQLYIKEGAGAFVCGEETALLRSIEGRRGEPTPKPPYPAQSGLWGKPTNINNVKTYAYIPSILRHGAEWFASIGTERSKGTAVFALTGKVRRTGLIEVPMGITLREIIEEIGGGVPDGKRFKAVQTGGPLGGCLPASQLDTPVDYDSLQAAGAVMGSGGMIVVDEDTCMVEFARFFLNFAAVESCGKCIPCSIGGTRLLEVLDRILEGKGTMEDLDRIQEIARYMQVGSLCGLGQLTPSPVLSVLRYFRDEFEEHIRTGKCGLKVYATSE
ncbi:MAG: NADH-quinone oxidoreductase subunit NuoF [Anaerolineae bacterium]|nr:NADH-quinone oxidoreductase subunit NuoF [Anaerolineae bacterium]